MNLPVHLDVEWIVGNPPGLELAILVTWLGDIVFDVARAFE
jgi:hypothetical protein